MQVGSDRTPKRIMNLRALSLTIAAALTLWSQAVLAQQPSPTSSPSLSQGRGSSLTDLQFRLRQSLAKPEVSRGSVGVKVTSLATGKVILESNAEKYFMPASNMKNFTVAAALERLGPDHRFITSIYVLAQPSSDGVADGDMRLFGRGDVSMSTRFSGAQDPMTSLDAILEKMIAAGMKEIEGSIVGDGSYFRGFSIPSTWVWDDLQSSYGAESFALPINDRVVT